MILSLIPFVLSHVAADITFIAVGDWGDSGSNGQTRQRHVAKIMNDWCEHNDCDFIMALGDNFYPDGAEQKDDVMFKTRWYDVYNGNAINDLVRLDNCENSMTISAYVFNKESLVK